MALGQLKELSVLVTRPREQSATLAAYIAERGGIPFIFPTLEIVPVEPVGGWQLLFDQLKNADIAIFTSANAVREVMSRLPKLENHGEIAAIGVATQMALADYDVKCDWLPMRDYRSEGLLALPIFQNMRDKKILLFAGEGGREYLQDVLSDRGASIEKIAVYRRECPHDDRLPLEQFFDSSQPKIIISTSMESLDNLLKLSHGFGEPRDLPLLVISQRMALAAKELGFQTILTAENASNEAIVAALTKGTGRA
jgi:uroporphyrinogen-III synthase